MMQRLFMSVPEEIRRVPRPRNTVVVLSGKGPKRFAVRERSGFKYGDSGNPQPFNGRVIGHIVDGKFVPVIANVYSSKPDMLSYGASAFVRSCSEDLLEDLYTAYSITDAQRIMAIASLRVLKPKISGRRLKSEYERTFISRYYPNLALSENTVSTFLQKLGQDGSKRNAFYEKRIQRVEETHHVAIDGTLKQNTSTVNDLSAYSRKARVKGCRDISIIYAYDLEKMEPVCAEVFSGNCIDASAYRSFIRDNNIRKGVLMCDKGFPPKQIAQELKERPNLHFLTPLKRNDKRIDDNKMYEFQGVLRNFERAIFFKKAEIRTGRFLYAYRDTKLAAMEERSVAEHAKSHNNFDAVAFQKKKSAFGTIVFESDQDLDPEVVYCCYEDRWQIELVFKS
ncbi:TRANSPOSASE ISMmy1C [gut metagenome]|uniref:TRANSPOSASE ISMmy1C n=1 Tax=gut metagenome TaxID=749906 RepID=J9GWF1_9ZZZZ